MIKIHSHLHSKKVLIFCENPEVFSQVVYALKDGISRNKVFKKTVEIQGKNPAINIAYQIRMSTAEKFKILPNSWRAMMPNMVKSKGEKLK